VHLQLARPLAQVGTKRGDGHSPRWRRRRRGQAEKGARGQEAGGGGAGGRGGVGGGLCVFVWVVGWCGEVLKERAGGNEKSQGCVCAFLSAQRSHRLPHAPAGTPRSPGHPARGRRRRRPGTRRRRRRRPRCCSNRRRPLGHARPRTTVPARAPSPGTPPPRAPGWLARRSAVRPRVVPPPVRVCGGRRGVGGEIFSPFACERAPTCESVGAGTGPSFHPSKPLILRVSVTGMILLATHRFKKGGDGGGARARRKGEAVVGVDARVAPARPPGRGRGRGRVRVQDHASFSPFFLFGEEEVQGAGRAGEGRGGTGGWLFSRGLACPPVTLWG
jgi:hypothetical protein